MPPWEQNGGPACLTHPSPSVEYPRPTLNAQVRLRPVSAFRSVPSRAVAWAMPPAFVNNRGHGCRLEVNTRNFHRACIFKMERNLEPPGLFPHFANKAPEQFESEVK